MRSEQIIFDEISLIQKSKRELILSYVLAQSNEENLYEEKVENTTKIKKELQRLNDKITELESEYAALILLNMPEEPEEFHYVD